MEPVGPQLGWDARHRRSIPWFVATAVAGIDGAQQAGLDPCNGERRRGVIDSGPASWSQVWGAGFGGMSAFDTAFSPTAVSNRAAVSGRVRVRCSSAR